MAAPDIAHRRLFSQRLLGGSLRTPNDVVSWLGAVQGTCLRTPVRPHNNALQQTPHTPVVGCPVLRQGSLDWVRCS